MNSHATPSLVLCLNSRYVGGAQQIPKAGRQLVPLSTFHNIPIDVQHPQARSCSAHSAEIVCKKCIKTTLPEEEVGGAKVFEKLFKRKQMLPASKASLGLVREQTKLGPPSWAPLFRSPSICFVPSASPALTDCLLPLLVLVRSRYGRFGFACPNGVPKNPSGKRRN